MKWIRLATVAALTSTIFAGGVQVVADDEPTDPEPLLEVEKPKTMRLPLVKGKKT